MFTKSKRYALGIAIAVSSATGCHSNPPPDQSLQPVYVTNAPPRVLRGEIYARPGSEFVWVDGYWGWRGTDYFWVPGRWTLPPSRGNRWMAGRWYRNRFGWYYVNGHWR